jgi:hypothetical protein
MRSHRLGKLPIPADHTPAERLPVDYLAPTPRDFYLIGDAIQQRSSGAVDPDFGFRNTVAQYFDKSLELPALSMFDGL